MRPGRGREIRALNGLLDRLPSAAQPHGASAAFSEPPRVRGLLPAAARAACTPRPPGRSSSAIVSRLHLPAGRDGMLAGALGAWYVRLGDGWYNTGQGPRRCDCGNQTARARRCDRVATPRYDQAIGCECYAVRSAITSRSTPARQGVTGSLSCSGCSVVIAESFCPDAISRANGRLQHIAVFE
jgi:hypothetical protein